MQRDITGVAATVSKQQHETFVSACALLSQRLQSELAVSTIILIIIVLLLVGALPSWPYSRGWGYGPSGLLGVVLVVLLILLLLGRL
jgi:hypothetical protein